MTDTTREATPQTDRDQGPILVGVDDSEHCARAFDIALLLAQRYECGLRLVATFEVPIRDAEAGAQAQNIFRTAMRSEAQQTLDDMVATAEAAGVPVSADAIEGHAAEVLIRESVHARLAVVGKRGRNRFAGRFLGSVPHPGDPGPLGRGRDRVPLRAPAGPARRRGRGDGVGPTGVGLGRGGCW
jgi:nucleotide-binding universal stress UspA family protein